MIMAQIREEWRVPGLGQRFQRRRAPIRGPATRGGSAEGRRFGEWRRVAAARAGRIAPVLSRPPGPPGGLR